MTQGNPSGSSSNGGGNTTEHIANTSDCLYSIAARRGVDWREVWEHADNAELRNQRGDPGLIQPGDRIVLPRREGARESIQIGETNKYKATIPKVELRLELEDRNGLYRNKPYTLIMENGREKQGRTDGDARLVERVPAIARSVTLVMNEHHHGEERATINLGRLPPPSGIPGLVQRLCNMGYPCRHRNGEIGVDVWSAVRRFQGAQRLEVTGELDEATRNRIVEVHDR